MMLDERRIVGETQGTQFRLIAVLFKEAALDSCSFRASSNHFHEQMDNIEKWFFMMRSVSQKMPKQVKELETYVKSVLEHLVPPFILEMPIDQEYTVKALKNTSEGLGVLFRNSLEALTIDSVVMDKEYLNMLKRLRRYEQVFQNFIEDQKLYDEQLAQYLSLPKSKDGSLLKESAQKVGEARKKYISRALELVVQTVHLGHALDKLLIKLANYYWTSKRKFVDAYNYVPEFEEWSNVMRYQGWINKFDTGAHALDKDLKKAKRQLEESIQHQYERYGKEEECSPSAINQRVLEEVNEKACEKHGHLYMKTFIDGSLKPTWIPRWAYIKGGMFGLLMVSPSGTFVQESDKVGVILCEVRYVSEEERRNCFELKSVDMTITFQTESLRELKSWLKVFANEQNRIKNGKDEQLIGLVSGRYPPILQEYASTHAADKQLTSTRTVTSSGQIVTSSSLAAHIRKHEDIFKKYLYNQVPLIRPPFLTLTSKSAIIAYSLAVPTSLPTALTANFFGSVNWGLYYLNNNIGKRETFLLHSGELDDLQDSDGKRGGLSIRYPIGYNKYALDVEMRALFETLVGPGEVCFFSFKCIRPTNTGIFLNSTVFLTRSYFYSYIQAFGFISLNKESLRDVVAVEANERTNYGTLNMYYDSGVVLRLNLYMDDVYLIERKLSYLVTENSRTRSKSNEEIMQKFSVIEKNFAKEKNESSVEVLGNFPKRNSRASSVSYVNDNAPKLFKTSFSGLWRKKLDKVYKLPPKAVFHALFGEKAHFLHQNLFIISQGHVQKPFYRNKNKLLERRYLQPVTCGARELEVMVEESVESMVDNRYYNLTIAKLNICLCTFSTVKIVHRVVVVEAGESHSRVILYSCLVPQNSKRVGPLLTFILLGIGDQFATLLDSNLRSAVENIGTHSMIPKSMYVFGKILETDIKENQITDRQCRVLNISCVALIEGLLQYLFEILWTGFIRAFRVLENGILFFFSSIRFHYILILLLIISTSINVLTAGKATREYWVVSNAEKLADKYLTSEPLLLNRAIYLKDTSDFIDSVALTPQFTNRTNSQCFRKYKNESIVLNHDMFRYWESNYIEVSAKALTKSFHKTLKDIGVERHSLITRLRMLNDMEMGLAKNEWKHWLSNEISKCNYLSHTLFDEIIIGLHENERNNVSSSFNPLFEYCSECASDMESLMSIL